MVNLYLTLLVGFIVAYFLLERTDDDDDMEALDTKGALDELRKEDADIMQQVGNETAQMVNKN